jgi:RNA polymerase sigma-70 factor (ECF subfamily)
MMTTKRHQTMPASARASVQRCYPDADLTARFVREVVPLRERLCRHAFGLTHDHYAAEDLVQETMLKACSGFQSFQPGTNLKAWLLRIMLNSHINHCRSARRHPVLYSIGDLTDRQLAQVSSRRTAAELHSAEEQWLDAVPNPVVGDAMRALPQQFREVVYYRDVLGLSYKQIAALREIPYGTVVSRLHRGRERLRDLLGATVPTIA